MIVKQAMWIIFYQTKEKVKVFYKARQSETYRHQNSVREFKFVITPAVKTTLVTQNIILPL